MRKQLLDKINKYGDALRNVSTWHTSKDPFGHIDSGTATDYVFELFCLLKIVVDLTTHQKAELVAGRGVNKHAFPKKPGTKANGWAHINILDRNDKALYEVWAGIDIFPTQLSGYSVAPDISFQKIGATVEADEFDVFIVMDTKYKTTPAKKQIDSLPVNLLREFAQIIKDVETSNTSVFKIKFDKLGDFKNNCLITNAPPDSSKAPYCQANNFRIICNFSNAGTYTIVG